MRRIVLFLLPFFNLERIHCSSAESLLALRKWPSPLRDFLNGLDVDSIARDIHGSRYFDFLSFVLAGLFGIVQHVGELIRGIAQNEIVTVLNDRP